MNYELLTALLDIGDIIQATGILFTTKRWKSTISDIKFLPKPLVPEKCMGSKVKVVSPTLPLIANPVREISVKSRTMLPRDF